MRVNLEAPESASRDKELVDERQRERKGNGLETASLFFGCLESSRFLLSLTLVYPLEFLFIKHRRPTDVQRLPLESVLDIY